VRRGARCPRGSVRGAWGTSAFGKMYSGDTGFLPALRCNKCSFPMPGVNAALCVREQRTGSTT